VAFPDNLVRHRQAVLEILTEQSRDPARRSALKTRGVSMAPLLRESDEVAIAGVPEAGLSPGDLIAYRQADVLFVHRLVAVVSENGARVLYEKGDNNLYLSPVAPERVLGVVTEATAGGRRLDLGSPRWRRLGRAAAAYGIRQVNVYRGLQTLGARLLEPGSLVSRLGDRLTRALLMLPVGVTLGLARRFL